MVDFLIDKEYQLQRYTGKGGWTYVLIPEIAYGKNNPFGWSVIHGFIDNYPLKDFKLMPAGKGVSFMPVKAEIRKINKKEAGDWVRLRLNSDQQISEVSEAEILECLALAGDGVLQKFNRLDKKLKKEHLNKIYQSKNENDKLKNINELIDVLMP